MKTNSNVEVEVKLRLQGSLAKIRAKLRAAGFAVDKRRVFEENLIFDSVDLSLSRSGKTLRIRRAGAENTLTYKGPVEQGKYKSREEIETKASNFENLGGILRGLGFLPVFRYEKYRTEYRKGKAGGVVTLDETPVGAFLEIEGAPLWIDRTAATLGFSTSDYVTQSYADLYFGHCREHGFTPGNMVFENSLPVGSRPRNPGAKAIILGGFGGLHHKR